MNRRCLKNAGTKTVKGEVAAQVNFSPMFLVDDKMVVSDASFGTVTKPYNEQLTDGKIYFIRTKAWFAYLSNKDGSKEVMVVSVNAVTEKTAKPYRALMEEIAIYVGEGLHPEEIFDMLFL